MYASLSELVKESDLSSDGFFRMGSSPIGCINNLKALLAQMVRAFGC